MRFLSQCLQPSIPQVALHSNWHHSEDISMWGDGYVRKLLFVSTVCCKYMLKLDHVNVIYQQHLFWQSSSEWVWHKVEKHAEALAWRFKLVFEILKKRRKEKRDHLDFNGDVLVPMECVPCTSVKAPWILKGTDHNGTDHNGKISVIVDNTSTTQHLGSPTGVSFSLSRFLVPWLTGKLDA